MKTVTAADANRYFSRILREVAIGGPVIVTSRGKAVARIEAVRDDEDSRLEREKAWKAHIARLRAQPALNLGKITRDEIYDD